MKLKLGQKVILSLGALALGGVLNGCVKEPNQEINYGPVVSNDEIALALQKASGEADSPALFRKDESVLRELSQYVRGRPVLDILSSTIITVVDKIETPLQWQTYETEEIQEYNLNNPKQNPLPIKREDHKCWNKETLEREECDIALLSPLSLTKATGLSGLSSSLENYIWRLAQSQQKSIEPQETITYHNLKTKTYQTQPPQSVIDDPNCRGIPSCLITVNEVEFDMVKWKENPEGYKIHINFKMSPDVPLLARIMESCKQQSIQIMQPGGDPKTAPRVLVTHCDTVKNFIPGN